MTAMFFGFAKALTESFMVKQVVDFLTLALHHFDKYIPYVLALFAMHFLARMKHGYGGAPQSVQADFKRPVYVSDDFKGTQRVELLPNEELIDHWGGIYLTTKRLAIESGSKNTYSLEFFVLDNLKGASLQFVQRSRLKYWAASCLIVGTLGFFMQSSFSSNTNDPRLQIQQSKPYPAEDGEIQRLEAEIRKVDAGMAALAANVHPLMKANLQGDRDSHQAKLTVAKAKYTAVRASIDEDNRKIAAQNALVKENQRRIKVAAELLILVSAALYCLSVLLFLLSKGDVSLAVKIRFSELELEKVVTGPSANTERGARFLNGALRMAESAKSPRNLKPGMPPTIAAEKEAA